MNQKIFQHSRRPAFGFERGSDPIKVIWLESPFAWVRRHESLLTNPKVFFENNIKAPYRFEIENK